MRTCVLTRVSAATLLLLAGGCGGGGGSGHGGGTLRKTFSFPHVLESSGRISRVAVGDVNGDGVPDLLVHDEATASVAVMASTRLRESPTLASTGSTKRLARGAGAYEDGARAFVWDPCSDLTVADVDGDGLPDLVAAGGSANQVGVWTSEVTLVGTQRYHEWRWPTLVDVGGRCDRVAAGDVNGDGRCDLVTLDESTGALRVLVQDPVASLTFIVDSSPPSFGPCGGLVLVDVDRDGRLDILTNRPDVDAIAIAFAGAAGFMLRESPTKQSTGRAMAVGDVDGDGWLDVVVLAEGGTAVTCLHQKPDAPGFFDTSFSQLGIAVDEQGLPVSEIAIKEQGVKCHGIAIGEPGTNGGRCALCQDGLALADMDRDGVLDLLCSPTANDLDADPIMVFGIRESPTRFSGLERLVPRLRESPSRPSMGRMCCVCDLDGDAHVDLVTGDPDFDLLSLQYVDDATPPPAPDYQVRLRESPTRASLRCLTADLDRDGHPDIVTATSQGLEIRWQDTAHPGTFLPPVTLLQGLVLTSVAIGDVNRDGCPDCIVSLPQACLTLIRNPAVIRGFLAPIPMPPPPPGGNFRSLELSDLDGDGDLDCVAIRESPSKASLGRGQGNGFFDVFTELSVDVKDPQGACLADLDGDGHCDVVVCGTDETAVLLQDPATPLKFGAPQVLALQRGVRVAAGDVNGDGRCDIVVSGDHGVTVSLQSPLESGRFLPAYALSLESCGGLALGDFDRDGQPDVAFVEVKTGTAVVVHGDPDFDLLRVISLNGLPPGVPYPGYFVIADDLNGDGKPDLVVCCPATPAFLDSMLNIIEDR